MADHLEILVEEPSAEAALQLILPKLIGETTFEIHPFQCKQDLLGKLPQRLRGYAAWLPLEWRVIVIVDRDDDNCLELKRKLERMARAAGLVTRSAGGSRIQLVNRIAVEELESWFFGDWDAVKAAYPRVSETIPAKQGFRDPDGIAGGTWEMFEKVLRRYGYFQSGLRKIEAARTVAAHMVPERNRSRSFQVFRAAVIAAVNERA